MADVVLSAELQARVDSFVANLLAAANSADNTSNSVTQMSTNISRNIANVNRTNLSQFTAAMNAGTLSVQRLGAAVPAITRPLTVGTNQAANALQNLGRVAQDAPFGFIGIQNNLNPLLESFQRLRAETGSNGAAFRALGQSLLGPAGIGIALSVVSSAILIYQQYQQKANKATNDAKKSTDDYAKSLDSVTAANLKGAQSAQKDLTNLNLLYQAYTNANLPLRARKEAYKELQNQYPSYFTNLKFEKEASEKTANAYNLLTQEILASARARAASDKISVNEARKLENEQKEVDLRRERIKLLQTQDRLQRAVDAGIGSAERGDTSGAQEAIDLLRVNKQVAENQNLINSLKTDTNLLDEQNGRLIKYVNTQLEKGGKLVGGFGDSLNKVKKDLQNKNQLGGINQDVGALLGIGDSPEFTIKPRLKIEPIVVGLSELQKIAEDLNKKFSGLVENTITGGISNVASSIGEALASGGSVLAAVGDSLLSTFSGFLSKFGELLIEYGAAAILKGKLDLAAFVPGAGIAAGIAAVAAGIALVAASAAINGLGSSKSSGSGKGGVTAFANGGIISGPTLGLMGEYAGAKSDPEVVAPLSKLKNLLGETDAMGNNISTNGDNYFFDQRVEIEGDKLVVLLERTQAKRKRFK